MQGIIAPSAYKNLVTNHHNGFNQSTLLGNNWSLQVELPFSDAATSLTTDKVVMKMNQIETLLSLLTCLN